MKKIYKIPKGQNVSTEKGVKYIDNEIKTFFYKVEQIPETWEELKELCKNLKGCNVEEDYIEVFGCLVGSNILFCIDGAILLNTDCCFKEKATFQQMWEIIKNLVI